MSASTPLRLIPLLCPACQQPLPAQPDEWAWCCPTCQRGWLLGSAGQLQPLDVFFSNRIAPGVVGKPFWVASGTVQIIERNSYNDKSALSTAQEYWKAARLFYIPAYAVEFEALVRTGVDLLLDPLRIEPGPPTAFLPVVSPPEDLQALADFIVYSLEARRTDALRTLKFDLQLAPPQLWIIE